MKLLPEQAEDLEKYLHAIAERLGREALAAARAEMGLEVDDVRITLTIESLGCFGTFGGGQRERAWERS